MDKIILHIRTNKQRIIWKPVEDKQVKRKEQGKIFNVKQKSKGLFISEEKLLQFMYTI